MKAKFVVAGVLVVVLLAAGAAGLFYLQRTPGRPAPVTVAPSQPAAPAAVPAPHPMPASQAAPADCLLPGPAPVPPEGATASEADMKLGHDAIQHFVLQLEAYQACRNAMIDHPPAGTTQERKEIWLQEGNAAVDDAHALADAFSEQMKIFHKVHK